MTTNCKHWISTALCTQCNMKTRKEEPTHNINCAHCEGNTPHNQISPDTYECTECGKRQENVKYCTNCVELTRHEKDIISDNCEVCGNDPMREIKTKRDDEWEPGLRAEKEKTPDYSKTTVCHHGIFFVANPCRKCKWAEMSGGGYSTTRKVG